MKLEVKFRTEGGEIEDGITLTDLRGPRLHIIYQRTIQKITYRLSIAIPLATPFRRSAWHVEEREYDRSKE